MSLHLIRTCETCLGRDQEDLAPVADASGQAVRSTTQGPRWLPHMLGDHSLLVRGRKHFVCEN
jgi:hypothetical protein